jgi:hypothetical protein
MPMAHIVGIPLEELALTGAGAGTVLLAARAWVEARLRKLRGASRA